MRKWVSTGNNTLIVVVMRTTFSLCIKAVKSFVGAGESEEGPPMEEGPTCRFIHNFVTKANEVEKPKLEG